MFGFYINKEKKFTKETIKQFMKFAKDAGFSQETAVAALPKSDIAINAVNKAYIKGFKPVDAAMILADLSVRDAEERVKFSQSSTLEKYDASKGVEKMIMSQEVLQAWANDSLAIAEKIQLRAFTIGIDLGAKIMLQEGKFGRKVSQILGDFSIQEDE